MNTGLFEMCIRDRDAAFGSILAGIERLQDCCETLVIVTNEIFSDGLPYPPETCLLYTSRCV